MSSIHRSVRTYGRRQSIKETSPMESHVPYNFGTFASSRRLLDNEEPPTKRRATVMYDPGTMGQKKSLSTSRASSFSPKPTTSYLDRSLEVPTAPPSPSREGSQEEEHWLLGKGKGRVVNEISLNNATRSFSPTTTIRDATTSSGSSQSYPSTSKKPKDLSRIFEAVSPLGKTNPLGDRGRTTPGKSGKTKKMLLRSKTEGSIELSSSKPPPELATKAQSFVVPWQPEASRSRETSPSPKKQLSRNPSLNSASSTSQHSQRERNTNARTYAGTSRSFLVALPTAALVAGKGEPGVKEDTLDEDDEAYLKDSYAELRERYGVDNSEGPEVDTKNAETTGEGLALYNPLLSSITDLRSKGESRRFRDEMGYIFEGLEANSALAVRRASALDIISKLSDQEFWKKARAAGLISEIWDRLRSAGGGNGDKFLDSALCCFAALASEDPRDISSLAISGDFVETIVRVMLAHTASDPLGPAGANGKAKPAKTEIVMLGRLRYIISAKADIVHEGCKPSIRLLLSCSLSAVPSLAFPHLSTLLSSASGDLASVCSRLAAYKSGLTLLDNTNAAHERLCFDHIYNCLAILDSYLIEAETSAEVSTLSKTDLRWRHRSLPSGMIALIVVADVLSWDNHSHVFLTQAAKCSELAFRILINLTNGDPTWTDAIIADPYTLPTTIRLIMGSHRSLLSASAKKFDEQSDASDSPTSAMDRLCLALALLTNLLQERDNLAYSLQNMFLDPACDGQRSCLLGCRCSNGISAVSALANLYISFLKSGDEDMDPDFLFLRGHLAVLIGLLLQQLQKPGFSTSAIQSPSPSSSPSQSQSSSSPVPPSYSIIDTLPGPPGFTGRRKKLSYLIEDINAFSALYASLTRRAGRADNSDSAHEARDRSDDSIIGTPHRAERKGASADSDIVANVAASLRSLHEELCYP